MIDVDKIIRAAIQKGASDIHLVTGQHPMFRISKALIPYEEVDKLKDEEMFEISDFIINGNVDKAKMYDETRKLDTSYVCDGIRLRVNASYANEIPVFTMRIIKNELPPFEALGVPDVVRRMTYQPQGLILVTGKILTLESPIEYMHTSKNSLIIQKEVGSGRDCLTYHDGVKNALREDCDILVIGEIRDKITMEAAIEMAESGHLVIGTLHTKSCAETIDRMINFYEVRDQAQIKYLLSSLLKLVVSQRLLPGKDDKMVLIPEVMVVDNVVSGVIRRDKISVSEIEDAIQSGTEKGSVSLITSLSQLFIDDKLTLEQAKGQIEEKNIEVLNRTIMQLRIKKGKSMYMNN